jgi:hypothetical protein
VGVVQRQQRRILLGRPEALQGSRHSSQLS